MRLLTRILPYIFEDPDWRGFFWSTLPGQVSDETREVCVEIRDFDVQITAHHVHINCIRCIMDHQIKCLISTIKKYLFH